MLSRVFLLALAIVLGLPAVSSAQSTGTLEIQILDIAGRDDDAFMRPFNKEECDNNVAITFRITGLPSQTGGNAPGQLDFWRGTNCELGINRSGENPMCGTYLPEVSRTIDTPPQMDFTVGLADLLTPDAMMDGPCAQDGDFTIYALGVSTPMSQEDTLIFGSIILDLDVTPPNAPGNARAGSGENQIPLSWDQVSEAMIDHYTIYVDEGTSAGGSDGGVTATCGTGALVAGQQPPAAGGSVRTITVNGNSSTGNITGLSVGESAAVAVLAVDKADNVGPLSNVVCVTSVATNSFWDLYQSSGGEADTCSVGPVGARTGGSWIAPLLLVGIGIVVRRRRACAH